MGSQINNIRQPLLKKLLVRYWFLFSIFFCVIQDSFSQKETDIAYKNQGSKNKTRTTLSPIWEKGGLLNGFNPSQEVVELRTKNSKKFDLGNGIKQVVIGGPFHFLNDDSLWDEINLNIKTVDDPKFSYQCVQNSFKSRFNRISTEGIEIGYRKTVLKSGINTKIYSGNWHPRNGLQVENTPKVIENKLTYPNICEGISLNYEVTADALLHNLRFDNPSVFNDLDTNNRFLSIEEEIQIPMGSILFDSLGILNSNRNIHGVLYIVNNSDTLYAIPPSKIWDENYELNLFNKVDSLAQSAKSLIVSSFIEWITPTSFKFISKIPVTWLKDEHRYYPVYFDPTIVVGGSGTLRFTQSGASLGYYLPWRTNYRVMFSQSIYDKSDITYSGKITSIEYSQGVNNGLPNSSATIRMQNFSNSTFSSASYITSGWSTFFSTSSSIDYTSGSGSNFSCSSPSQRWVAPYPSGNFTPFQYDNSKNLLVETRFQNSSFSTTSGSCGSFSGLCCTGGSWYYYTPGNDKVLFEKCDGCTTTYYPSTSNLWNLAPIVRLTIDICTSCPSYDYAISPSTSWQTHSGSHQSTGCKMYRVYVQNGYSYTFKTGCADGATADYDTYLTLYDGSCNSITSDDDGCSNNRSIVTWNSNFTGYIFLKVHGFGSNYGNYTLAYSYRTICTTPGNPSSLSVYSIGQNNASFSWSAGSPSGSSSISYYWVVGTNSGVSYGSGIDQGTTTNTYVSSSSLNCNTTYYFRVYALTNCDNSYSGYSTSGAFTTSNCNPPIANFSVSRNNINAGATVNFFDNSTNSPTSYNWSFNGGSPSTSTSANPTGIRYNTPGQYRVSLRVCNSGGCNTKFINAYITVKATSSIPAQPNDNYFTRMEQPDQSVQDPIHLGTGTYKYIHSDFVLPNVSTPLIFKRYYNSINYAVDGVLGFGWSHSYNYVVTNLADTLWQVKYPDGHSADFIPLYNGGGTSFPFYGGTTDSLSKTPSGYDFITKEQNLYQFDANGRLMTITDPNNNVTVLHYNGNLLDSIRAPGGRYLYLTGNTSTGKISTVTTPSGKTCSYRYDASNNLVTTRDANADSIRFTYNGNHEFISFINALGDTVLTNVYTNHKVTAQYDAHRKLTRIFYDIPSSGYATVKYPDNTRELYYHNEFKVVTYKRDALGKSSTMAYDDNFYQDTVVNEKSQKTIALYDRFGNPLLQIMPGNRTYTGKFNRFQKPTEITNPIGNKVSFDYNSSNGNLLTISFPDTSVRKFNYNTNGTTKFYIDGRGDSFYYFYNKYGDLIKIKTPTGHKFYGYNPDGRLDSLRDENGNLTLLFYDNNGNLKQIKDALNQSLYFSYDDDNQLVTFTDKRNYNTYFSYDKKGRLITRKNALNGVDSFYYDIRDRIVKWRDANGNYTTCKYDSNGRRTEVSNAVSRVKFEYDDIANLTKITDANNHELKIAYNISSFTQSLTDGLNHKDTMGYDAVGNLKILTNYKGNTRKYNFDPLNQLVKVIDVQNEVTSFRNDKNGNLKSLTDGNGHTQTFTAGKASWIATYKDAAQNTYSFSYDSAGNLKTINKPVGSISNMYDKLNRLTKQSISTGDVYDFSYDENSNLKSAKNNNGTSTFYYDALNRMNRYVDPFGKEVKFGFTPVGSIDYIVYPGNDTLKYTYDKGNRLWKVKDWKNNEFVYSYDSSGKVKKVLYPTGIHCDYTYDAANRLVSKITYTSTNKILYGQTFTFPTDTTIEEMRLGSFPAGIVSDTLNYQYREDDAIKSNSNWNYTNDNNGNRVKDVFKNDTIKYTYTADQLLTSINKEGITTTFKYDALGNRIQRTRGADNTRYVLNLNSPISLVLQTTDGNGNLRKNYIYGLGLLESIDSLGNVLFYHFDGNHNTVAITDKFDSVKATYTYLPKGALFGKTGTLSQPFTFLGEFGVEQETDSCYYIRARYYDAGTGRFLSKDPLFGDKFEPQTLNRYLYALNNPFSKYDATGLTTADDEGLSNLDKFQLALDVAGLVPVYGEIFDGINALIYLARGDKLNASLSAVAIIPVVGSLGTAAKIAGKTTEVAGTATKLAKSTKAVEQYTLRAAEDGFYPVMKRGFSEPQEMIWLNKDDIWKVGTSKNSKKRYSQKYLDNIGDYGVNISTEFTGSLEEALKLEKMKILNFKGQSGFLPPGNKIIK